MKQLMTGNEAVARGAFEAGLTFASAYPGTPSTEILENMVQYKDDIYCEWAPNEKVALEAAIGASIAGARSMAAMKHVGVNVAADPLFTFAYTRMIHPCFHLKMNRTTETMQQQQEYLCWSLLTVRNQRIS